LKSFTTNNETRLTSREYGQLRYEVHVDSVNAFENNGGLVLYKLISSPQTIRILLQHSNISASEYWKLIFERITVVLALHRIMSLVQVCRVDKSGQIR